ncbi:MAG: hypothetical protein ACTHL1_10160 [Burkholderiaceae bacterium]
MRRFLLPACLLSMAAVAHADAAKTCRVRQVDLLGAWEASGDTGPFEEMEFASAGSRNVFHSWLHQRPDIVDGTWSLRGCALTIVDPAGPITLTFHVRTAGRNRIELQENGAPAARYVRIDATP